MYYVLPLMIAPLVTVYCSGPSSPLMVSTIECLVHTCHFLRPPSSSSCFPFLGKISYPPPSPLCHRGSHNVTYYCRSEFCLNLASAKPNCSQPLFPFLGKKRVLLLLLLLNVTVVFPSNNCSSLGFCLNLALAKSPPQLLVLKLANLFRCQPPP